MNICHAADLDVCSLDSMASWSRGVLRYIGPSNIDQMKQKQIINKTAQSKVSISLSVSNRNRVQVFMMMMMTMTMKSQNRFQAKTCAHWWNLVRSRELPNEHFTVHATSLSTRTQTGLLARNNDYVSLTLVLEASRSFKP